MANASEQVSVQVTIPSSGHGYYDRSEGGSQGMLLYSNKVHVDSRSRWMDGLETLDLNTRNPCLSVVAYSTLVGELNQLGSLSSPSPCI